MTNFVAPAIGKYTFTYRTTGLEALTIRCSCGSGKFESNDGGPFKCTECFEVCDFKIQMED
jgi:hypothetical protein